MSSRTDIAHPLETLQGLVTELEAAITLCLADPGRKPVHKLRTGTRRIEAHLELLAAQPGFDELGHDAAKLRRKLVRLRRAAGRVRDLDVQQEMADKKQLEKQLSDISLSGQIAGQARKLVKHLKKERKHEAERLLRMLGREQGKVTRAMETLLENIDHEASQEMPVDRMIRWSADWFAAHRPYGSGSNNEDQLHQVRKSAKLVRYVLESTPEGARQRAQDGHAVRTSADERRKMARSAYAAP